MSNGAGYRSPKSNVPNAPVRIAGIAPTTTTKGQIVDKVLSGLIEQGKAMANQSFKVQTQLNLNELESEVLADLNEGSSKAISMNSAEEVESTFNDAMESAQGRLDGLTGNNLQVLQTSLNKREGLIRAGQISPRIIGIRRDVASAKAFQFYQSELSQVGEAGNVESFNDAVAINALHVDSLVEVGALDQTGSLMQLTKNVNGFGKATVDGMYRRGQYDQALAFLESPEAALISQDLRDRLIVETIQLRSIGTKADLLEIMTDPGNQDPNSNVYLGPEGLNKLRQLRESRELTPLHHGQLVVKRNTIVRSRVSHSGGTKAEQDTDDLWASIINFRDNCTEEGLTNCRTLSQLVPSDSPHYAALQGRAFEEDFSQLNALHVSRNEEPITRAQFAPQWARETGHVPRDIVIGTLDSIRISGDYTDQEKQSYVELLSYLRDLETSGQQSFNDIKVNVQQQSVLDFYDKWKMNTYGTAAGNMSPEKAMDLNLSSGPQYADGGQLRPVINKDMAFVKTHQTSNLGFEAQNAARASYNIAMALSDEDGLQVGSILALEYWNEYSGSNSTLEDLGPGLINSIIRTAGEKVAVSGMTHDQAFATSVNQEIMRGGWAPTSINVNGKKEIAKNALDNPLFEGMHIQIPAADGTVVNVGMQAQVSDTNLSVARRLHMVLESTLSKETLEQASVLGDVIQRFTLDTIYQTGHAQFVRESTLGPPTMQAMDLQNLATADNVRPAFVPNSADSVPYNSLQHILQTWVNESGLKDLDEAYNLLNDIALGERQAPGVYWEPGFIGDDATRNGITPNGLRATSSWIIEAQTTGNERDIPIKWGGNVAWRKDFPRRAPGPMSQTGAGSYLFPSYSSSPLATSGGRLKDFAVLSDTKGDSAFQILPTSIDGQQLTDEDALAHAKMYGLENFPTFESQDEALSWLARHEGLISGEGQLLRLVGENGKPVSVTNPAIIQFGGLIDGMTRAERQAIIQANQDQRALRREFTKPTSNTSLFTNLSQQGM